MKHCLIAALLLFIAAMPLQAQTGEKAIVVTVATRADGLPQPGATGAAFVNGYRRTIDGSVLPYHSSHPNAESALLARALQGVRTVTWESDTLREAGGGDFHTLIWLAGLAGSKGVYTFDLSVNGQKYFTFTTMSDTARKRWSISREDGSELRFEAQVADRASDLFGYMFLRLPRKDFAAGHPLTLQVSGEDAGSPAWYMTFEYSFNFTPRVRVEPALLREGGEGSQLLRLSLDNLYRGRAVEVRVPNRKPVATPLAIGANILLLPIDRVSAPEEWSLIFRREGEPEVRLSVDVRPVRERDVYLLSYSHNDIGYTDLQPRIERKQWRNIDEALRLIRRTKEYPPEAQFKWNMEVIWALEGYLKSASAETRREFFDGVRAGRIGLNALFANFLTGLANAPEMTHFTEYARRLSREYSLPITTALVSDVPGFTWGIVPVLASSGVRYFSSAPNSSDRIGYTLQAWGDRPFYWTSQSGKEKVLMWVAGASYSSFHEGELPKLGEEKIMKLLRKLDETDYPYTIVQLPYTVGGDNGPPDAGLSDYVRQWNERYIFPRLIIATHNQMFSAFEKKYGAALPSVRGDFTPYWEDGASSSASETAVNRHAADRLIQSEVLFSMLNPWTFPADGFYDAWRQVLFYDEHTWGAWNSVSEPDSPGVKGQWAIKRQFALTADSLSQALLAGAVPALGSEPRFAVYNTNSWPRTDLVVLPPEHSRTGDRVLDDGGKALRSQRLSTGELAVLVKDVPPFGYRTFHVSPGRALSGGKASAEGTTLANGNLSAAVGPTTGAVEHVVWKKNFHLVDNAMGPGWNQYLYVPGKDPQGARELTNVRVRRKEPGGLVASLLVEADAPGCRRFQTEVRVIDGIDRIDIINEIDKEPVRRKEGVHFAFPMNVPDGQLRYDVACGIVKPEIDQLSGACKNFFSVESWVDVSNEDYGVTVAAIDAPLIEIGAITAERPWMKTVNRTQMFYSYVMNNYWHTNYKADQEGPVRFEYSVMPHADFSPAQSVRFGRERRERLVVAGPPAEKLGTLLRVEPATLLVQSVTPVPESKSWLVSLYNPGDDHQVAKIRRGNGQRLTISRTDLLGETGEMPEGGVQVPAHGVVYLKVSGGD
jgi:alpha-mannosidase